MVILRTSEIRDMSSVERREKMEELELELMKQRAQIACGGIVDLPVREIRRTIARIKTVEKEGIRL